MTQCPWKIRASANITVQCRKLAHEGSEHEGEHPNPQAQGGVTLISWMAGDRREYIGEWPGSCKRLPGCVLHDGHHGNCAI